MNDETITAFVTKYALTRGILIVVGEIVLYGNLKYRFSPHPSIEVEREVTRVQELGCGWDGECIPYGGDGNTRLGALLTANA